jgi:hypothetical protein
MIGFGFKSEIRNPNSAEAEATKRKLHLSLSLEQNLFVVSHSHRCLSLSPAVSHSLRRLSLRFDLLLSLSHALFFPALVLVVLTVALVVFSCDFLVVTVALVYLCCFIWIVLVVLFLGCVRFFYLQSDLCFVPGLFCFI